MSVVLLALAAGSASAAPVLRVQVDQRGDFILIGNTLGHDCAMSSPMPVVGMVSACGAELGESAPDVFWRADSPAAGQAEANAAITVAQARSSALLEIPAGATVTHAYLYWGARRPVEEADTTATLEREGIFSVALAATASWQVTINKGKPDAVHVYQSVADVTTIIQANGPGTYRVGDVDVSPIVDINDSDTFAGWWMAVFYELPSEPQRNLALFDGLDRVSDGYVQDVTLSGLEVPGSTIDAKLGVVAYEGDNSLDGDQIFFNGGEALTDGQNPGANFFNGTRSRFGAPVSVPGDLPQLTGQPQSMAGVDIDVVDIVSRLMAGDTTAAIQATSSGDLYYLAGFVTSISSFGPSFNASPKTAKDLNGGDLTPGDVIEYTLVARNTGNDASMDTMLTDELPAGVTYVPGSLVIVDGDNAGAKTDAAGDDQAEYVADRREVRFRLGAGATADQGGSVAAGGSTTMTFQVSVDAFQGGVISNQAIINAGGVTGSPPRDTPTDGNGALPGAPPTDVTVLCSSDSHCRAPSVCDLATKTCTCVPSATATCPDGVYPSGNGVFSCASSPAPEDRAPPLFLLAAAASALLSRRRLRS
jgi:uncharacterized repeat protein (TIGR01451 family)/MYXO-CTERM domain-containing protein